MSDIVPNANADIKCQFCKWWCGETPAGWGLCKRHPPTATCLEVYYGPDEENFVSTNSPRTGKDDWCGDFVAKGGKK